MKPKSLLTVLLALALSGGLLWAFPTLWMALVLTLLGLVAIQATLIRRGLSVVRADQGAPGLRVSRAYEDAVAAPAFANQSGTPAKPALDPAAFARFRAHLETVEQARGLKPSTPPAEASGGDAKPAAVSVQPSTPSAVMAKSGLTSSDPMARESAGVSDQVALSAKSSAPATPLPPMTKVKTTTAYGPQRRVVMPGAKSMPPPKLAPEVKPAQPGGAPVKSAVAEAAAEAAAEAEAMNLFDDLRPNRAGTLPAKVTTPLPPPPDVVGDAMRANPDMTPSADESAALLKLAEDAFRRGDRSAARAALDQHLSIGPADQASWQALRLHVRISALGGEPQLALDGFDAMLKAGYPLTDDGIAAQLEEILEGAPADIADSLRVSLLLKVLGVFRQATNRPAMDHTYRLLIEAQERVGDERKLVQFLKNHLEIKKVMGETAGQLEIIDEIGNRLFKLGQTAEAREYYELGLKLRADLQAATPTAKSGTTPQPA
jgi:tetratricopeptide (TPR) repeat protein